MNANVKQSGNKCTLKIIPERGQLIPLTNWLHRLPDPAKGSKNQLHWHIKIKTK
jgi:hypothetical protein